MGSFTRNKDSITIKYWQGLQKAFKSLYVASLCMFLQTFDILETCLFFVDLKWTELNYSDSSDHCFLSSLPPGSPLFVYFPSSIITISFPPLPFVSMLVHLICHFSPPTMCFFKITVQFSSFSSLFTFHI